MTPPLAAVTIAVAAAAARLFAAGATQAGELAAPPPLVSEPAALEIAVVGSAADLARVRALVRPRTVSGATTRWRRVESFNPLEILRAAAPEAADPRGQGSQATRCWIDLTDRRHAHLYFAGRSGARFLIRDVELSGTFDELDLTSLSEVIDLSLTAVAENDLTLITRAQAEDLLTQKHLVPPRAPPPADARAAVAAAPPVATAARAVWSRGVAAGLFYAAQSFADQLPVVSGPGLIVSVPIVNADAGWQVGVWISGQYQIPANASADLASVRLATIATRAGVLALWPLGHRRPARFGVEARLGAGADTIHLTPQPGTQDGSATLTAARWSTSASFTGGVGVVATLGEDDRVRLGVRGFVDLLPIATHYDVAVAGQPVTVVAPDRVRPGALAELTVVLGR